MVPSQEAEAGLLKTCLHQQRAGPVGQRRDERPENALRPVVGHRSGRLRGALRGNGPRFRRSRRSPLPLDHDQRGQNHKGDTESLEQRNAVVEEEDRHGNGKERDQRAEGRGSVGSYVSNGLVVPVAPYVEVHDACGGQVQPGHSRDTADIEDLPGYQSGNRKERHAADHSDVHPLRGRGQEDAPADGNHVQREASRRQDSEQDSQHSEFLCVEREADGAAGGRMRQVILEARNWQSPASPSAH